MILDAQMELSHAQSLTGTAAQVSTDYYDFGAAVRLAEFRATVNVSAKAGTTPDLKIDVFGDNQTSFATEKQLASRTIVAADLVAGKNYHLEIGPTRPYRYVRFKYTQSGNADNTATVTSWIVAEDVQQTDILLAGVDVPV
jgi:hypothetical protein